MGLLDYWIIGSLVHWFIGFLGSWVHKEFYFLHHAEW